MPSLFVKLFGAGQFRGLTKKIRKLVKGLPSGTITPIEVECIRASASDFYHAKFNRIAGFSHSIENSLEKLWYPKRVADRKLQRRLKQMEQAEEESRLRRERGEPPEQRTMFSLKTIEPEWYLAMTNNFTDSIRKIDRKLQGRILDALGKISKSPDKPIGNTLKPLTGDMKGFWRYRIGDYRLIYQPDETKHHIYLLSFAPRGSAYST